MQTTYSDDEMALIRVLSHSGTVIAGAGLSQKDIRERIRHAIFAFGVDRAIFCDGPETFAQVFQRCYDQKLERRANDRSKPIPHEITHQGENYDEDDFDDTE